MKILGISCFYHDSAAALVVDGELVAATQEERFTRIKNDSSFPEHSIKYCLASSGLSLRDVDQVVFYDKPLLTFDRILETYFAFAPRGIKSFMTSFPLWIKEKLLQKSHLADRLSLIENAVNWHDKLFFSEHHMSHAASAFFPSPFDEALVLTLDGVGEWATTAVAIGRGNTLEIVDELHFPHSLGLLYSAFTYHLGFRVNSGEYKVMGLAPYGVPRFKNMILKNLIDLKNDGSYRLNMKYFDYCTDLKMTNRHFSKLFGMEPRVPESEITQVHMDLAASIQDVLEEVILKMVSHLVKTYKIKNLCLAGGVALNCAANGKLLETGMLDGIWVQPAAGDAGGAVGAALAMHFLYNKSERVVSQGRDSMKGAFLGPSFSQQNIEEYLTKINATYVTLNDDDLLDRVTNYLLENKVLGWFQGQMEFGPRALGARSIIADPRPVDMKDRINKKIKKRESFRPFAPAVLEEHAKHWFNIATPSPYMQFVAGVKKNDIHIPAVTHVNNSARIQTVNIEENPKFHALIEAFYKKTGCPILVNTSFNVRGEPIVCTPEDAYRCFMTTDIDVCVLGNCLLIKGERGVDEYYA